MSNTDKLNSSKYQNNRKLILANNSTCAICNQEVDKTLDKNNPLAPQIDHIKPRDKGGTSSLDNLQLVHRACNREKSDKQVYNRKVKIVSPRNLPQVCDLL